MYTAQRVGKGEGEGSNTCTTHRTSFSSMGRNKKQCAPGERATMRRGQRQRHRFVDRTLKMPFFVPNMDVDMEGNMPYYTYNG